MACYLYIHVHVGKNIKTSMIVISTKFSIVATSNKGKKNGLNKGTYEISIVTIMFYFLSEIMENQVLLCFVYM